MAAKQPEIDLSTLSEEEKKIYAKYGHLPKKSEVASKRMAKTGGAKKYFDSAEHELNKNKPAAGMRPVPKGMMPKPLLSKPPGSATPKAGPTDPTWTEEGKAEESSSPDPSSPMEQHN